MTEVDKRIEKRIDHTAQQALEESWRVYLTNGEFEQYEFWEKYAKELDEQRRELTVKMNRLRNRAAQRRRSRIGNIT